MDEPNSPIYRVIRVRDGLKEYYAGHYVNGHEHWVTDPKESISYPTSGLAVATMRGLSSTYGIPINVVWYR